MDKKQLDKRQTVHPDQMLRFVASDLDLHCSGNTLLISNISVSKWHNLKTFRGFNTHGIFSTIFYKGDNFCDFPIAILQTKLLRKRRLLWKERICSQEEQILSFQRRLLFRREAKLIWQVASPESVLIPIRTTNTMVNKNYGKQASEPVWEYFSPFRLVPWVQTQTGIHLSTLPAIVALYRMQPAHLSRPVQTVERVFSQASRVCDCLCMLS